MSPTYPTNLAKPAQIRSALAIYRVLAIVAGIALFVLILEMVMKYAFHQDNVLTRYWSPIHGLIYMAYAASVANLGRRGVVYRELAERHICRESEDDECINELHTYPDPFLKT